MKNYIVPQIKKFKTIEDLLENNNRPRSLFDTEENLSIDKLTEKLFEENFVCIVGEPGIGKSRLLVEIQNQISIKLHPYTASNFEPKSIPENQEIEYCTIDALDEVDGNDFFSTLQLIKRYKEDNPNVKVLFTCRKHYVASHATHFASCNNLTFIELCKLNDRDVMKIVDSCSETIKESVAKSPKLKELLTIPRYLTYLWEYEKQKSEVSNISDLFEFIIGSSIHTAIDNRSEIINKTSIKILIQRVLERVAFIMEISRKNQILKDELYTILDGVRGNMTQMLIANFDLLFFESRILKDTDGTLQFESTELQEYLAAKELCRQDNIESVLYDVAVQKDLKHVYPNWYDVIPHISYTEDKIHTFINVIKLIVSYESNLENDSFESLLRYVDPSVLVLHQKEELFSLLLEHYLRVPAYIESGILNLIKECYTSKCNVKLKQLVNPNKIQLANITEILKVIVEEKKLDKNISDFWVDAADGLIQKENEDERIAALKLYDALKAQEILIRLSESYPQFPQKVKEKYCEVTGYNMFTSNSIVNCWLEDCYTRNPYAINAVLYTEDCSTIKYAYKCIIENNKLREFFNPNGTLFVYYELHLKKQFEIIWNLDIENKILMTKVVASFLSNHLSASHVEINDIVKQILLEEKTGSLFINCFENKKWYLEKLFKSFDAAIVDSELISALDILLHKSKILDLILTTLINKIRGDEIKKDSVSEYLSRYADTFEIWDKYSEEAKTEQVNPIFFKDYETLSDPNVPVQAKYETVFELAQNIEFLRQHDSQPIVDVIEKFFNGIDLDEMILEKKENNSFSLSMHLVIIPYYVRAIYHLGIHGLLEKHRVVLAKTLPIICCIANIDAIEIKKIYKSIIGNFSEQEKSELVAWWKSREDDYMDISPDNVFACITDYGIDALSYKLEEYIEGYINNQETDDLFAASKALELISKGFINWDVEKYRNLFNAVKDDNIKSIKMQCNAIMIEKYQDAEAITWRIEYVKNHIVKSLHNDTRHARSITIAESEMISRNPCMFGCFMNIKGNEKLIEQIRDLFDFALTLSVDPETQQYSSYLLNQIYLFFVTTNDFCSITELRKKVEKFNTTNVRYLVNSIMNDAEMKFLQNDKISIGKSIRKYNKCIDDSHLEIRNDGDLRRFFTLIQYEVQKEIQDQGIYAIVCQESLGEDFIQRELKNTIINKCCQMGLEAIQIDREVALQDNKRTDLLIRYGLCNPIMVEVKLLHNKEIQNKELRQKYKEKFIKYANATCACLSVFWIFNVHKKGSNTKKFKELGAEYSDLDNTKVILTDCKCSSGIETGVQNKRTVGKRKRG